ncbi:MAG: zinc carboxypeptidase, partial [bacterium]|nr:zinc carboxypeptidase [bacterium]
TEVETQAVRGLAISSFATKLGREEVGNLKCALSWHSYGGVVGHPMGHVPTPPNTGLTAGDRVDFGTLTMGVAGASGYGDIRDTFPQLRVANGDPYDGYSVYGDTDDWFYKDRGTLSILIEAYSSAEGQTGSSFYPHSAAGRDAVAAANVKGARELIRTCTGK